MTIKNEKRYSTRNYCVVAVVTAIIISTLVLSQTNADAILVNTKADTTLRTVDPFMFELETGSVDGARYTAIRDGGMPEASLQKHSAVTLPLIIRPTSLQEVNIDFTTTYGGQLESSKMPPGVHVVLEPSTILLKPGKDSRINVIVQVDSDAPDGLYMQNIVGKWGGPNDFLGTAISLKIGNGSPQFVMPGDILQ